MAVTIGAERYESEPIRELRDWILSEEFIDEHKRVNQRRLPLQPLSLLDEVEAGPYREGHHPPKWIGCLLPLAHVDEKKIKHVSIKFHDKDGIAGKLNASEWPVSTDRIIDRDFF